MSLYYIIIASAALQGVLLAGTLKKVSNNKRSLSWLSTLLIAISLCLLGRIFYEDSLFGKYPKIAIASDLILFTYGPLIFWYIRSVFYNEVPKKIKVWMHFIAAGFHLLWLSQYLFVPDAEIFRMLSLKFHQTVGQLTEMLSWVHILLYLAASFEVFYKYPQRVKAMVSNVPGTNFLAYFFILNTIVLGMWATGFLLRIFHGNPLSVLVSYNSIWILLTCSVYMIGYYAIVFPQVFRINAQTISEANTAYNTKTVAQEVFIRHQQTAGEKKMATVFKEIDCSKSAGIDLEKPKKETILIIKRTPSFSNPQVTELTKKLQLFMETEKPYLDSNLTLPTLSAKLSCTVHLLSKVINEGFDKNFFDYINNYRVYHFMQLAQKASNGQYTILSLAFESGFNSKSTFNTSFKKVTGKTPSDFIKSIPKTDKTNEE